MVAYNNLQITEYGWRIDSIQDIDIENSYGLINQMGNWK